MVDCYIQHVNWSCPSLNWWTRGKFWADLTIGRCADQNADVVVVENVDFAVGFVGFDANEIVDLCLVVAEHVVDLKMVVFCIYTRVDIARGLKDFSFLSSAKLHIHPQSIWRNRPIANCAHRWMRRRMNVKTNNALRWMFLMVDVQCWCSMLDVV